MKGAGRPPFFNITTNIDKTNIEKCLYMRYLFRFSAVWLSPRFLKSPLRKKCLFDSVGGHFFRNSDLDTENFGSCYIVSFQHFSIKMCPLSTYRMWPNLKYENA